MKNSFIHKIFSYLCFGVLLFCIGFSSLGLSPKTSIYSDVLRLHVIASGNSASEQELKYKVRDGILDVTGKLFEPCKNLDEALVVASDNASLLENTARATALQNGYEGKVSLEIGREFYPEKTYGNLTFPKGEYLSVKIILGQGKGQNWWCVLFPPLCNAGVQEAPALLSHYGLDDKQINLLQKKPSENGIEIFGTRVSLKILELLKREV